MRRVRMTMAILAVVLGTLTLASAVSTDPQRYDEHTVMARDADPRAVEPTQLTARGDDEVSALPSVGKFTVRQLMARSSKNDKPSRTESGCMPKMAWKWLCGAKRPAGLEEGSGQPSTRPQESPHHQRQGNDDTAHLSDGYVSDVSRGYSPEKPTTIRQRPGGPQRLEDEALPSRVRGRSRTRRPRKKPARRPEVHAPTSPADKPGNDGSKSSDSPTSKATMHQVPAPKSRVHRLMARMMGGPRGPPMGYGPSEYGASMYGGSYYEPEPGCLKRFWRSLCSCCHTTCCWSSCCGKSCGCGEPPELAGRGGGQSMYGYSQYGGSGFGGSGYASQYMSQRGQSIRGGPPMGGPRVQTMGGGQYQQTARGGVYPVQAPPYRGPRRLRVRSLESPIPAPHRLVVRDVKKPSRTLRQLVARAMRIPYNPGQSTWYGLKLRNDPLLPPPTRHEPSGRQQPEESCRKKASKAICGLACCFIRCCGVTCCGSESRSGEAGQSSSRSSTQAIYPSAQMPAAVLPPPVHQAGVSRGNTAYPPNPRPNTQFPTSQRLLGAATQAPTQLGRNPSVLRTPPVVQSMDGHIYQQTTGGNYYLVQLSKSGPFVQPPPLHGGHRNQWQGGHRQVKVRDLSNSSHHRLMARAMRQPYTRYGGASMYGPSYQSYWDEPEERGCIAKKAWNWLTCKTSCCWGSCCGASCGCGPRPDAGGGYSQYGGSGYYSQYGDSMYGGSMYGGGASQFGPAQITPQFQPMPSQRGGMGRGKSQRGANPEPMGIPQVQTMNGGRYQRTTRGHYYPVRNPQPPFAPPPRPANPQVQTTRGGVYQQTYNGGIYRQTAKGGIYPMGGGQPPQQPQQLGQLVGGPIQTAAGGVYGQTVGGGIYRETQRGGIRLVGAAPAQQPQGGLVAGPVQTANGGLYGATANGGIYKGTMNGGVYKVGQQTQQQQPQMGGLMQAGPAGGMYGATANGGLMRQTAMGNVYGGNQIQQQPMAGPGPFIQAPPFRGAPMNVPRPASSAPRTPRTPRRPTRNDRTYDRSHSYAPSRHREHHQRSRSIGRRDKIVVVVVDTGKKAHC